MEGQQKCATAACIIKDNKVLLLHRVSNFDLWEFPGGGIEFGENPKDGATRETGEETGLKVKNNGLLGVSSYLSSNGNHHIFLVYKCEFLDGEVKIGDDDHTEYSWFTYEEIEKIPNLSLSVKFILKELRNLLEKNS